MQEEGLTIGQPKQIVIKKFNILDDIVFDANKQEFVSETLPRILIVAKC